jgi:hypothetical protein
MCYDIKHDHLIVGENKGDRTTGSNQTRAKYIFVAIAQSAENFQSLDSRFHIRLQHIRSKSRAGQPTRRVLSTSRAACAEAKSTLSRRGADELLLRSPYFSAKQSENSFKRFEIRVAAAQSRRRRTHTDQNELDKTCCAAGEVFWSRFGFSSRPARI